MSEWIPIWKQLPENDNEVLVTTEDGKVLMAYYQNHIRA